MRGHFYRVRGCWISPSLSEHAKQCTIKKERHADVNMVYLTCALHSDTKLLSVATGISNHPVENERHSTNIPENGASVELPLGCLSPSHPDTRPAGSGNHDAGHLRGLQAAEGPRVPVCRSTGLHSPSTTLPSVLQPVWAPGCGLHAASISGPQGVRGGVPRGPARSPPGLHGTPGSGLPRV